MSWVKANLFRRWYDGVLTVVVGAVALLVIYRVLRFVFVTGRWEIIRRNISTLLIGLFPRDRVPMLIAALVLLGVFVAVGIRVYTRGTRRPGPGMRVLLLGLFAASVVLLIATGVELDSWGGLLLTLFLAVFGIALSFPIGVLLALGRRSTLPVVRYISVGYIELIRGVPLLSMLFMGFFVIGFLVPPGVERPSLAVRALIAYVMFTSAYIAEIVRGGLQAVPREQTEAATALGLSHVTTLRRIVLPQALRAVIPAIVGQFISLFKDTSLVAVLGLTEFFRVTRALTSQDDFIAQGLQAETLVFASFVYWIGSYAMSRGSRRLERRLARADR